ncbi:MAG: hypothetical protein Q4E02_04295 [Lagierella massiliensis]|nr:hypothetical protein [Lagierella massiliensis]
MKIMKREDVFKKMGFWNNFYLILTSLSAIFSVFSIVDTFITKSSVKQLEDLGIDSKEFMPTTFDKVMLIVTTAITIYCVVMAFKNRKKIIERLKVDIIPYALTLIMAAYNFILGIVVAVRQAGNSSGSGNNIQVTLKDTETGVVTAAIIIAVVTGLIVLIIKLLPAIRMLILNSKVDKYPDEEENLYEQEK